MGVLAPPSIGGTPVVLNPTTNDVDTLWQRGLRRLATFHDGAE